MPSFKYSAKDAAGASVRGEIEAVNRKLAVQKLVAMRLRPVSVVEGNASGGESSSGGRKQFWAGLANRSKSDRQIALSKKVALPFLSGLKELVSCGVQAGDALQLMSTRLNDPRQKRLAHVLWEDVRQGRSLSEAFRKQSKVFDESVVSLVEAGEATGSLNNVLGRIVSSMEEGKAIKSKLVSALAYPIFLIFVALCLVLLFLFFLLPRIEKLLASLGGNLPWSTKLLIFLAENSLAYGWIFLIGLAFAVVSIVSWRKTPKGRKSFDGFILKVPLLGRFLKELQVLRLTQVLSLLLQNGITMVQSLSMTERSLTNYSMRARFLEARGKVTEGASLSSAFRATGYFDGMALDIFTVGENTGNVIPGLRELSRQYAERVDATIKAFLGIVSVAVLLFVFAFVGLVAMGIISAVMQMSTSLSG